MQQYLIMFRSLTYAQRASAALERAGVVAGVARAPSQLSNGGCGYCLKLSARRYQTAKRTLDEQNFPHGKIYIEDEQGEYREVSP